MKLGDTLPGVSTNDDLTLRQFAGNIVTEEIARMPGKRKLEQVLERAGISRSTYYNIRDGLDSVRPDTFWAVAAALDLPTHFFEYVIDGDISRLQRLPGVRDDLRQHVVDSLQAMTLPRTRRSSDRRRA